MTLDEAEASLLWWPGQLVRAASRAGLGSPLAVMVARAAAEPGSDDPRLFGWSDHDVSAASREIDADLWDAVEAETDVLAADPWESMTESRRTRALGVIEAA